MLVLPQPRASAAEKQSPRALFLSQIPWRSHLSNAAGYGLCSPGRAACPESSLVTAGSDLPHFCTSVEIRLPPAGSPGPARGCLCCHSEGAGSSPGLLRRRACSAQVVTTLSSGDTVSSTWRQAVASHSPKRMSALRGWRGERAALVFCLLHPL